MEKHPVRFTHEQIGFLQHMLYEYCKDCHYDLFTNEEECIDIEETIIKAEHNLEED